MGDAQEKTTLAYRLRHLAVHGNQVEAIHAMEEAADDIQQWIDGDK